MIRTSVASIPVHSRATGGVIVMRLSEGAKLVTFARVEKEEEIIEEAIEAEEGASVSDDGAPAESLTVTAEEASAPETDEE